MSDEIKVIDLSFSSLTIEKKYIGDDVLVVVKGGEKPHIGSMIMCIPRTEEQLNQISAGFCAGMGNMEATCGTLIGAGMIAGLKTEGKGTLPMTRQIQEEFGKRCGAIRCKDLKAITDGKPLCPCQECVRNAVLVYGEIVGL